MPSYGRYRTRNNGPGYQGTSFIRPDDSEVDQLDSLQNLTFNRVEQCFDTVSDHFTVPGIGRYLVEQEHDFLLERRSFRYENRNDILSPIFYVAPAGPVVGTSALIRWVPLPLVQLMATSNNPEAGVPAFLDHLESTTLPSNPVAALIARTNPGTPAVDVPAFFGELRDFPRLFQAAGDSIIRGVGSAYLNWKFGWTPLLNDLKRMVLYGESVTKRLRVIRRLLVGGISLPVRLGVEKSSSTDVVSYPLADASPLDYDVDWKVERQTSFELWGNTRWRMPSEAARLLRLDDDLQRWTALRTIVGAGFHPATLWELLPWSWLSDWFFNTQTYLEVLYSRPLAVEFGGGCVCFKRTTLGRVVMQTEPQLGLNPQIGFRYERTTKRRDVFSSAINAVSVPGIGIGLTRYQVSILTALVASKQKLTSF